MRAKQPNGRGVAAFSDSRFHARLLPQAIWRDNFDLTDPFRDAEFLVEAIDADFSGNRRIKAEREWRS